MSRQDTHILVVNDDNDVLNLTVSQLHLLGYASVARANDGEAAIESIRARKPHLILTDIAMPKIDGFQLCRVLKSPLFDGSEDIPVILTSATYRDVMAEQLARNVNAFAYLQQPYDLDDLGNLLRIALGEVEPSHTDKALLQHVGTIVIIDDDHDMVRLLEGVLIADNWKVLKAYSAEEGKTLLSDQTAQLVMLDYRLPQSNGLEMLKWIKQNCPQIAVIMMTANTDQSVVVDLIKHGADDYLRKPVEFSTVSKACANALNRYNFLRVHEQFQEKIEKLRAISDYLDLVVNFSQDAIFSCDANGIVKIWNKGAEKMYGYLSEEILGKIIDDYVDPPDFSRKSPEVSDVLRGKGSFLEPEIRRKKKNGDIFHVSATYSAIHNFQGDYIGFSIIERDVSTLKALEAEKIKSARLRAITQTAVTANDHINTPLGVIVGYAQFLEMKLQNLTADDKAALAVIQQQAMKIKTIMNKLKLISDPIIKNYSVEGVTMIDLAKSTLTEKQ